MGCDESPFNVSFFVQDKVTRQCLQTTASEEKGKPKRTRTELASLTPYRWAKPALIHSRKDAFGSKGRDSEWKIMQQDGKTNDFGTSSPNSQRVECLDKTLSVFVQTLSLDRGRV